MSSSAPKVSVVMPVKDCSPVFLKKSVESILNQTFTNLELVVVVERNLKPVNPVKMVLDEYRDDHRLRLVENTQKGFVEALNFGLMVSKGEYIARLDGDDISLPNRIRRQFELANAKRLTLVGAWAHIIDENDLIIGELTPPVDALSIRRQIMLHNPFLHSAVFFKKSVIRHSGWYNNNLYGAEDYDLWLRIISLGYSFANVPEFLILLRETRGSVTRGTQWRRTRYNYVRVKSLGIARLGYHDPLSLGFSLVSPVSLFIPPQTVIRLKSILRFFQKKHRGNKNGF